MKSTASTQVRRQGPGHSIDPTDFTPQFALRRGRLFIEGVGAERIGKRVGTPAYVYSKAAIAGAYRRFDRAFAALPHSICYSVKANSNLAILRLLARLGSGFDIVSGGELYRLQRIGVPGRRIVFSGVGKTREEIREALSAELLLFNVESPAELELLAEEASRQRRVAHAALRVNPDVEAGGHPHISTGHHRHKFGVDWDEAMPLYLAGRKRRGIRWRGISAHIGSQILSVEPFRRAVERLAGLVRELARVGVWLDYFDFGGGVGVRYAHESPADLTVYARAVVEAVKPLGCRLLLEPGRVLVGSAGILLTRVLYLKRNHGKTFIVVDAAMNDFLRPALYGAVHPITMAAGGVEPRRTKGPRRVMRADIVGPICETGDCFVRDWLMEEVGAGDLVAIWGTGAYGFVAASNYNSRPRPAEVLVEGSRFHIIRRRETRAEMLRGEWKL